MLKNFKNGMSILLLTGIIASIAACSQSTPAAPTLAPDALITQAAQTVAAQFTLTAAAAPQATNTPVPPATNTPAPAAPTTAAEQPTLPPAATNTQAAAVNPTSAIAADMASFVEDVTVPDGTGALPGDKFPKIWRIKNTGKTIWTAAYSLVFIDGERMGAPDKIDIPKEVRPGETVDITANLTAPTKPGSYQAYFRLRNASGQFFKLDGTGDLWVKIVVGTGATATPTVTGTPGAGEAATPTVTPTK